MFTGRLTVLLYVITVFLMINTGAYPQILSGTVNETHVIRESGVVLDGKTGLPVGGAYVSVPSENTSTVTDKQGGFHLDIPRGRPAIMSVKKDGYKPFSTIIGKNDLTEPLKIIISEKSGNELVIDAELHHLGDNKYSQRSANAGDFSTSASGASFLKQFFVEKVPPNAKAILIIGSIIGIDTIAAQCLNQSNVRTSSSSPVKVYLNSAKIGDISINGDGHRFYVPPGLLRSGAYNHVRIETGINLDSEQDTDYDDIEFMNMFLDIQQ